MPRKPAADPVFDVFWTACPKRRPNPRERARRLFNALVKAGTATAEELTAAVRAYATEMRLQKTAPQFCWMASTFLGEDRWRDYLPDAEATADPAATPAVADDRHPLGGLVDRVGIGRWTTWFKPLLVERVEGLTIIVAPSKFHADRIRSDYEQMLRQLWSEIEVRP